MAKYVTSTKYVLKMTTHDENIHKIIAYEIYTLWFPTLLKAI